MPRFFSALNPNAVINSGAKIVCCDPDRRNHSTRAPVFFDECQIFAAAFGTLRPSNRLRWRSHPAICGRCIRFVITACLRGTSSVPCRSPCAHATGISVKWSSTSNWSHSTNPLIMQRSATVANRASCASRTSVTAPIVAAFAQVCLAVEIRSERAPPKRVQ